MSYRTIFFTLAFTSCAALRAAQIQAEGDHDVTESPQALSASMQSFRDQYQSVQHEFGLRAEADRTAFATQRLNEIDDQFESFLRANPEAPLNLMLCTSVYQARMD